MRALHTASWIVAAVSGALLVVIGGANGHKEKSLVLALILGGLALLAIVSFVTAVFTTRLDCPACKAYAGHAFRGDLISSRPLHMRTDGQPDRRYKHNPTIEVYEQKGRCSQCKHEWLR